ncbi:similar to XAP-5 protein (predicted), isoform CRA_b [Rattus norvegicus]|uniref:Similar to XAP-5 protein (Predicted), isoform CRA_b n=1 Tax=Rattus norvegicus TaxID=10116 RepID=A6KRQ8_RAT|nr:similar to XAP-5 protein (predicted), isoform CRA_b [Rattus norvegicus]
MRRTNTFFLLVAGSPMTQRRNGTSTRSGEHPKVGMTLALSSVSPCLQGSR